MTPLLRRLSAILAFGLAALSAQAQPDPPDWTGVLAEARGQTVYWHAWGGSSATNDFIAWLGDLVAERYGVTLEHVKLTDTADAVTRVLAEKQAGVDTDGAVDLIWLNGANFTAMKQRELLFGPFASDLPNHALVAGDDAIAVDFGEPVDGMESPWAKAQFVFMYDSADARPLPSMQAILDWAVAHPGRITYPQPPDFVGVTFLKQALVALVDDPAILARPVSEVDFAAVSAPLWDYLDRLTPVLWRQGRSYPASGPAQFQLLADNEIDLAPSISPGEASAAIADFRLPSTIRTFVPAEGTIGNASFVAIPYNSDAKAGAMVVANALLSPDVQLRAQDPDVLGYGTVLDMDKVPPEVAAAFADQPRGPATLSPAELGTILPEPHASWVAAIEEEWSRRYGVTR
ncbi:ABC transporter, periplasmic binding protein [Oceaniovalibus guishaninsula JLT2003]|uniref:ABC transporter, periplasmic binding protein n=1 Tax=Oceaniovalibus guishaninsula JLT2003 TaxID=1231392 RepID=K2H831_9RHOB|nr:ABC transporter substrate-binding protein [Oceaniovalibus guishaninsula]EKE43788.1 ABC transporter, periplasmic binding protein [Oceaniovalibus guishaninsula JLT2003]